MDDTSEIERVSDAELLNRIRINSPGNASREAAKTELEFRQAKRLAAFAEKTERSGKRMEYATYVILLATVVQLVMVGVPMLLQQYRAAASNGQGHEPQHAEQAPFDPTAWSSPEIEVVCSENKLLPAASIDGKTKEVVSTCTIRSLMDRVVSLAAPGKTQAVFRLPNGAIQSGRAYLGSSEHEIPPHGEIQGGLWFSESKCPIRQSDYDCLQAELMKSDELLLTDTASAIHYHVRLEKERTN